VHNRAVVFLREVLEVARRARVCVMLRLLRFIAIAYAGGMVTATVTAFLVLGINALIDHIRKRPADGHVRAAEREERWYPLP
jgi:hypothetical protein